MNLYKKFPQSRLYITIIFSFSIMSCERNDASCGENPKYYYLYSKIPYELRDTIKFVDSTNNQLTFVLSNKVDGYIKSVDHMYSPDCGTMYKLEQYSKYYFSEINNKANLWIGNYISSDTIYDNAQIILISINHTNFGFWTSDVLNNIGSKTETTLNGVKYYNIFTNNPTNAVFVPEKSIFYSKELGVIAFKTDSIMWHLKK